MNGTGGVTSDGAVLTDPVVQTQTGRLGPTDLGHTARQSVLPHVKIQAEKRTVCIKGRGDTHQRESYVSVHGHHSMDETHLTELWYPENGQAAR